MLRHTFCSAIAFALLSPAAWAGPVVAAADPQERTGLPDLSVAQPATAIPEPIAPATQAAPQTREPAAAQLAKISVSHTASVAAFAIRPAFLAAMMGDPPKPVLFADIDLSMQTITISDVGGLLHTWKISSGTASYATETGTFRGLWTARMWHSRKYGWAPMPHAVFFNGGTAVHATQATSMLGQPASHGCIRLAPENAKTFYELVQKHGTRTTQFVVHGTPTFPAYVARASVPRPRVVQRPQTESIWGSFFGYADEPAPVQTRAARRRQAQQRAAGAPQRRAAPRTASN